MQDPNTCRTPFATGLREGAPGVELGESRRPAPAIVTGRKSSQRRGSVVIRPTVDQVFCGSVVAGCDAVDFGVRRSPWEHSTSATFLCCILTSGYSILVYFDEDT
jgi:hypothetical protein